MASRIASIVMIAIVILSSPVGAGAQRFSCDTLQVQQVGSLSVSLRLAWDGDECVASVNVVRDGVPAYTRDVALPANTEFVALAAGLGTLNGWRIDLCSPPEPWFDSTQWPQDPGQSIPSGGCVINVSHCDSHSDALGVALHVRAAGNDLEVGVAGATDLDGFIAGKFSGMSSGGQRVCGEPPLPGLPAWMSVTWYDGPVGDLCTGPVDVPAPAEAYMVAISATSQDVLWINEFWPWDQTASVCVKIPPN